MRALEYMGHHVLAVEWIGNGDVVVRTVMGMATIHATTLARMIQDQADAEEYVLKDIYDKIGELTDAVNVLTKAVERLDKLKE